MQTRLASAAVPLPGQLLIFEDKEVWILTSKEKGREHKKVLYGEAF